MPAHLIYSPFTFIDTNGDPVSGGYVKTFEPNGSSTPKALYSDKALTNSAGTTHTLNSLGQFNAGNLFGDGDYYFEVYYADGSLADTYEYIEGEGSGNNAATEWVSSVTPTYISATSFSVPGDLTSDFHVNRRVKTENTGGTVYSTIVSSVFSSVTTVTVVNDSGTLDSGLSSVELGFLRADNQSSPASKEGLIDSNGNKVLIPGATASAVNEVTVTNAATGNKPSIDQTGTDDVGIDIEGVELHNGSITASSATINTIPVYGLVVLDTPENLVSSSTTGSWQTVNSTTLNTAGATKAILRISTIATLTGTSSRTIVYIRKTGSGLSAGNLTVVASGEQNVSSSTPISARASGESLVNLDTNGDFDWYHQVVGSPTPVTCDITLVGYYV